MDLVGAIAEAFERNTHISPGFSTSAGGVGVS